MSTFTAISIAIVVMAIAFFFLLAYAMCRAAGRADQQAEDWADFDRDLLRMLERKP